MTVRRETRKRPGTGEKRTYWRVDFWFRHPDGRRERIRLVAHGSTRRQAEVEERAIIRALEDGTFGDKKEVKVEKGKHAPKVSEFAERFVERYAMGENKPSEVQAKRSIIRNYIEPHLGDKRIDEVGREDIDAFKSSLINESKLSRKTTRNALAVVSRMLRWAEEIGVIDKAPRVQFPKCPLPPFDFFTPEEADLLLTTAKNKSPSWYVPIYVALKTGLRRGELFALEWGDVQLSGRSPHLRISRALSRNVIGTPKNGKVRTVYITPATVAVLEGELEKTRRKEREHKSRSESVKLAAVPVKQRPHGGRLVFAAADGSPISSNSSDWALRHVCELAGLREVGWHMLRHTYASHLAMRGVSLQTIQEQLGHSGVAMTLRYAHLSPESVSGAIAVLDDAINEARIGPPLGHQEVSGG